MKFISYQDSLDNLLSSAKLWSRVERIPILLAKDRVISQDIIADDNYPNRKTAALDGYACKFSDLNLGKLKVVGMVPAGSETKILLQNGCCVKTFTGAMICDGADTLIQIENVKESGEFIEIKSPVGIGNGIRDVAQSYAKGDTIIKKGTILRYSEMGILAELGYSYVNVFIKPRVGILSTGSEIVDIGDVKQNSSQIYNSNQVLISALLQEIGCEYIIFPVLKDDKNIVKSAILDSLNSCDFLITTGGVSVGDFDFVRDTIRDGFIKVVDGANIKPGRHIKIAKIDDKYIFALPGFPYSCVVTFLLYFREFINKILHLNKSYKFQALIGEEYKKRSKFQEFVTARLVNKDCVLSVTTMGNKTGSSAIISNLNDRSVLIDIKNDLTKKGEIVDCILTI